MNFKDLIDTIYQKKRGDIDTSTSYNITLTKWLGYDKDNLSCLTKIVPYFYYLQPSHYFYLLYFNIPKKSRSPWLGKIEKPSKKKDDSLLLNIQETLGWSDREVEENMSILEKVIMINKKDWKTKLGVK